MKSIYFFSTLIFGLNSFKHATDLYIVGDSLSDVGNTWQLTGGKLPDPRLYYEKRYSNGPVWNEYLAKKFPLLNLKNYAFSGATSDNEVLILQESTPSLKDQAIKISKDLNQTTVGVCKAKKNNNRIAIIWGGGNDFLVNTTIAAATFTQNTMKSANILMQTKKFDNILIFNLVNIARTPYSNSFPPVEKELIKQVFIQLNKDLAKLVKDTQEKDNSVKLSLVDVDAIAEKLINSPSTNSLKWEPSKFCVDTSNLNATQICNNPNDHFFWDNLHPTTVSHERVANELEETFKQLRLIQ